MQKYCLFKLLAFAMLLSISNMAKAADGRIGFCFSNISENGIGKTGRGRISAATIIPKSELASYSGAKIKSIRVALKTTDGLSNLSVWLRHSLSGEDIYATNISSPITGWNEAFISEDIRISDTDNLVIGFSFDQDKTVRCISIAGADDKNGYWIAKDNDWQNRSDNYYGSLSAEVEIEGDMIPEHNLRLVSATPVEKVVKHGEPIRMLCVTRNTSLEPVNSTVNYSATIDKNVLSSSLSTVKLKYGDCDSVMLDIPTSDITPDVCKKIDVSITTESDTYYKDNSSSANIAAYTYSEPRNTLLEEFTSEYCSNCPRAIETIAKTMENGFQDKTILITHHVGFTDDWLTVEEDKAYLWFYGDNGSYAPAGMLDRSCRKAYGSAVPVFEIGYADTFQPMLEEALSVPAFISVSPNITSYNPSTRILSLQVSMKRLQPFDVLCSNPRITVILIEDSIKAMHQAGYNTSLFKHRHVFRKCISNIWGDDIVWDGNSANACYQFAIPETWNADMVGAVAFVSNYNSDNRNDCQVMNSGMCHLGNNPTSITTESAPTTVKYKLYRSLAGTTLSEQAKGTCIETTVFSDGSKSSRIIIR